MAGNRKHGFRRGNAAGRNGVGMPQPWFCSGCGKEHGRTAERTKALDGLDYCERTYYAARERILKERAAA